MRIKVEGSTEFAQVQQILQDVFLRAPYGARIHGLNLYLTLQNARGEPLELLGAEGQPIDVLTYRVEKEKMVAPFRSASPLAKSRVVPLRKPASEDPGSEPEPPTAA